MSKTVTINGSSYTLNVQSDNPPWGEQLSDLLQALIDVSNNITGTGDILNTTFIVSNNVGSATNVTGLQFDTGTVRSAIVNYSIYRSTDSNETSECGVMLVTYKNTANSWELAQYSVGDASLIFTITSAGQIQYTSSNMAGLSYSGTLKFSAKAFTQ